MLDDVQMEVWVERHFGRSGIKEMWDLLPQGILVSSSLATLEIRYASSGAVIEYSSSICELREQTHFAIFFCSFTAVYTPVSLSRSGCV